jgi:hypothetical protein
MAVAILTQYVSSIERDQYTLYFAFLMGKSPVQNSVGSRNTFYGTDRTTTSEAVRHASPQGCTEEKRSC